MQPLIYADFPDPDVIRVHDTYYMITTTMHMFPGGDILKSRDLIHWEPCCHIYDTLDGTARQRLTEGNIYGQGMWAACLRYHKSVFHAVFVCNDTHKSYHFTAADAAGPWQYHEMQGFYHDCSLLFEEDRVFIVHGNRSIHLTEMKNDLSAPLENGTDTVIVRDSPDIPLGYEGSHFYKINGKYCLFLIHWPDTGTCRRTESCFVSDCITGPYRGCTVLDNDIGFFNQGVAQGGIVDDPDGNTHAVLFQDRGAVGRVPVICDVTWTGEMPQIIPREGYGNMKPLIADLKLHGGKPHPLWQFNHQPDKAHVRFADNRFEMDALFANSVLDARNTLTQRAFGPACICRVTVDASRLHDGDKAGLAALQGCFAQIAVIKLNGQYCLQAEERIGEGRKLHSDEPITAHPLIPLPGHTATLEMKLDFRDMKDTASFYLLTGEKRIPVLTDHKLYYRLDHFMGCRPALFCFSRDKTGGTAVFTDFNMQIEP